MIGMSNWPRRFASIPLLGILALASVCSPERPEQALPSGTVPDGPAARLPTPPPLRLSPAAGPPGTEVTVTMSDLVINVPVQLAFGTLVGYEFLSSGRTDQDGGYSATVRVLADAQPGESYFFLADADSRPVSAPTPFEVTAP